ncbi:hypothetical protein CK203_037828 [Vitis vinifera]|uniref:Uncharacterized protein n=1 Tax=Vitis vinifera TaxID=29760 RepID=A0A438IH95_VITVI|nr:hypothetical protein CK203_037828 [Vitis vinifera]
MPTKILQYTTPLECFEKENKKTKPTESEFEIGLLERRNTTNEKNRNNLEPVVYSRKKVLGRSKDQPIIPAHGQLKALGNGSLNASVTSPSVPNPIHAFFSCTDLSLPSHFDPSPEISAP